MIENIESTTATNTNTSSLKTVPTQADNTSDDTKNTNTSIKTTIDQPLSDEDKFVGLGPNVIGWENKKNVGKKFLGDPYRCPPMTVMGREGDLKKQLRKDGWLGSMLVDYLIQRSLQYLTIFCSHHHNVLMT